MSAPAPEAATPPVASAQRVEQVRRAGLGGQPDTDELAQVPPVPEDQKEPQVAADEDVGLNDLDVDDMAEIETGEPAGGSEKGGGEEGAGEAAGDSAGGGGEPEIEVQAKAISAKAISVGAEGGPAPADAAHAIGNPGPGRALPKELRGFMEPRFAADFSNVRLHDQASERHVARRIGARAFTRGQHVWLGPGESAGDKRLMAHELTHVVQQVPSLRSRRQDSQATPDIGSAPRRVQRHGHCG